MATIRILFVGLCLAILGHDRLPHRPVLSASDKIRTRVLAIARAQVGVREKSGLNDGDAVERYLASVGLAKGAPWCAAFVSWIHLQAGLQEPKTGWSPALFNKEVLSKTLKNGQVFGIWFPNLKRIAHVGLVEKQEGAWIISIEGNTNVAGSREGDGVYRKRRLQKHIYAYADWISRKEEKP